MSAISSQLAQAVTPPIAPSPKSVSRTTFVGERRSVQVPGWVRDLASFRRWVHSGEYPEKVRICYLAGEIWMDLSMEDFFPHNQLKNEFAFVLTGITKSERSGRFVPDGMLITNVTADLSCEPDGMFVSHKSWDAGRVRLVEGNEGKQIELEGTPDMALQIVSDSSTTKDRETLRELFWQAGIPEYWLVDARGDRLEFEILRRTAKGYVAVRKQGGWVKSKVFGKHFRLSRTLDERGDPEYTLEVK